MLLTSLKIRVGSKDENSKRLLLKAFPLILRTQGWLACIGRASQTMSPACCIGGVGNPGIFCVSVK